MMKNKYFLLYISILFVCFWTYLPLFYINYPVQDECHFFDPVYELFKTGRWAAPYNFYLGGGIEKTAYGHPPSNGLIHSILYGFIHNGFLSVRLTAFITKIAGLLILSYILLKEGVNILIIICSVIFFSLHNYGVLNVSRPDFLASMFLFLFTFYFKNGKYHAAALLWGIAFSFHQIMGIVGTFYYLIYMYLQYLNNKGGYKINSKQLLVAPIAGLIGIILWILPILLINGISGLYQAYEGTIHHLSIVDRDIEWYTSNVLRLISDEIPYFICLILSLLFFRSIDLYSKALSFMLILALIFVSLKTVNTAWYYYMFCASYIYLFAQTLSNAIQFFNTKTRELKVTYYTIIILLSIFIFRTRHTTVFIKNQLELINNNYTDINFISNKVKSFTRTSKVLCSPQFYHIARPHFSNSYDVENFGTYGSVNDLETFDYLFLAEEHKGKGNLHRLNKIMIEKLNNDFELVYDSESDLNVMPFHIYMRKSL
jgi:hypothetical protein